MNIIISPLRGMVMKGQRDECNPRMFQFAISIQIDPHAGDDRKAGNETNSIYMHVHSSDCVPSTC